jgi:acyl transferase domain-containing protein/acyl carrier protein
MPNNNDNEKCIGLRQNGDELGLTRLQILQLIEEKVLTPSLARVLLARLQVLPRADERDATAPIAVVGMSGRFPDAANLDALWANLSSGRDSVREMPSHRWEINQHWAADPQCVNKTYCKWGSILDDIDQFDPGFFGISPREARLMDPQQRLFLMEAWRALEDAGYSDRTLGGTNCSVFVGAGAGDYQNLLRQRGVPLEGYTFMGANPAVLSSRISYHLNLKGPSLTVDTSCSSSLMAVHLACNALRDGTCEMALAGGVAILVTPELYVLASKAGMLSSSGRCRTFDDGGDGFVPGEGVGIVVLKKLQKAMRDRDHIYGVITASGANQDGKTNGITAPSGPAQTALEIDTYARFGIDPAEISYVECHGTGTRLGDPIEVRALSDAFARFTGKRNFCALGSVKSNFGHSLTAAGIAGLIKVLLCLKYRQLVPSLHVEKLNRYISLAESAFYVNGERREWETPTGVVRSAAVSSFGFSGTNVHAVLSEAPQVLPRRREELGTGYLCPISAKNPSALREKLSQMTEWLEREGRNHEFRDIAYTLAIGRSHFSSRAAFVARTYDDLHDQIKSSLCNSSPEQTPRESLRQLANAYLSGQAVEWEPLFVGNDCRRIPLPTYPFARDRYWVPEVAASPVAANKSNPTEALRPLSDISSASFALQQQLAAGQTIIFRRTINEDEPLVRDHVVLGKPLLPAAGNLAVVHGFLREILGDIPLTVSRAVFLRPLFVEKSVEIQVAVTTGKSDRLKFEVRTAASDGTLQRHSSGEVSPCNSMLSRQSLPISEIHNRCSLKIAGSALYNRFRDGGILYGPYFTTVQQIYRKEGEAIGELCHRDSGAYFPAGAFDGALQSVAALEWDKSGIYLPFAMDKVHLLRPVPRNAFVHLKKTPQGNCNVCIVDCDGLPCITIEGFSFRQMREPQSMRLYVPEWRESIAPNGSESREKRVLIASCHHSDALVKCLAEQYARSEVHTLHLEPSTAIITLADNLGRIGDLDVIYFLAHTDRRHHDLYSLKQLEQSQDRGVGSFFRLTKALLRCGYGARKLKLKVVTSDVHSVAPDDQPCPYDASLLGFCKSLAKECPNWKLSCIDLSSRDLSSDFLDTLAQGIVYEPSHSKGDEVVYRNGRRYERVIRLANPMPDTAPAFRHRGTYLILGGAGGIGSELALHLARKVQARLVLVGRRALTPTIETKLRAIEAAGGEAVYLQADAADEAAMSACVIAARDRFGPIHGAFHSALVLRDMRIEAMDESNFNAALRPKVQGAVSLARALRGEKLDFLVFFSSAQSFTGNPAQSNYAAGCAFKDAFAVALRHAGHPAQIVNWGYWGEVGIVATPAHRRRMEGVGVYSISASEGLGALETLITNRIGQAMPLKADRRALEKFGVVLSENERTGLTSGLHANLPPLDLERLIRAHENLATLAAKMLVRAIQAMGALLRAGEEHSTAELGRTLSIAPTHLQLWKTLLEILAGRGYLAGNKERWFVSPKVEMVGSADLSGEKQRLLEEFPELQASAALLCACVDEYPRILRGEIPATQVIFPNSSMALLEPVYSADPLSSYLNKLAAQVIKDLVESQESTKVRILEIGAGTGATSAALFESLAPYGDRIEYVYTDVSLGFLQHGRKRFGKSRTWLEFKRLDIERNVVEQGFEHGDFDIVVAANVLHATRRVRNTVAHVKSLMRAGGSLILSETTAFNVFTTLTFGLLEGWWRWDDPDMRVPGSPLVDGAGWSRLLREASFGCVSILGPGELSDLRVGQRLIVARLEQQVQANISTSSAKIESATKANGHGVSAPITNCASSLKTHDETGAATHDANDAADFSMLQVENIIAESISQTLGHGPGQVFDPEKAFTDYGVDSIVLVELVNTLNTRLGMDMKPTALFDNPNLLELSRFIMSEFSPTINQARAENVESDHSSAEAPVNAHAFMVAPSERDGDGVSLTQVESIVGESIATTLGHGAGQGLDPERPFIDYGVDSIVLVELVNTLNARLGIDLKPTALFDNPNLTELSQFIWQEFGTILRHSCEAIALSNSAPPYSGQSPERSSPDQEIALLEQLASGRLTVNETYLKLAEV